MPTMEFVFSDGSNCSWVVLEHDTPTENDVTISSEPEGDGVNLRQIRVLTVFVVSMAGVLLVGSLLVSMCYKNERFWSQMGCREKYDEESRGRLFGYSVSMPGGHHTGSPGALRKALLNRQLLAIAEAPKLATQAEGMCSTQSLVSYLQNGIHSDKRPMGLDMSPLLPPSEPLGILQPSSFVSDMPADEPFGVLKARQQASTTGSTGSCETLYTTPSPSLDQHGTSFFQEDVEQV